MAKHNQPETTNTPESAQPNGLAANTYQFRKGRYSRINSHIGTIRVKAGNDFVSFTGEQLKGEQYKDQDYTGQVIKDQNPAGWRYAMSKLLPYPNTEGVATKEQLLAMVSDLYDDINEYNAAETVTSLSGKVTGPKAFPLLTLDGQTVAGLIAEKLAYGIGLHYQNKLMRDTMTAVAEVQLRSEAGLAPAAKKAKVAKPATEDSSGDEI